MNDANDEQSKTRWTEKEIREAFQELAKPDATQTAPDDVREIIRRTREESEKKSFADKEASRSSGAGFEHK
ncbi:MAG TPA: hypothetical protein VHZ07_20890 [Bryobacteraceae bacterium]|jgi:hypothetical protein|nr:hypothetical protein [Bryobacteraceae bacterium]